jgi:teichuronic acid biosynthesis glycosyltransferase TuaG
MSEISVVIPSFNAEKYLVETLDSIRKQTVQPKEIIVVNDCSTDRTETVVYRYICQHSFMIKIVRNTNNLGIGATRQKGALEAKGKYVAFLSADDCYDKHFIEKSLPYLSKNTATYTTYYQCDSKLCVTNTFKPPEYSRESVIKWALDKNMYVNFSSIIVPKEIFGKVSFEMVLRHGEDLIFLLDTVAAGLNWHLINEPLLYYRIHDTMGSVTQKPSEFDTLWFFLRNRLTQLNVPKHTIDKAYTISRKRVFSPIYVRLLIKIYHTIKAKL